MKIKPTLECLSCILRQIVEACEYATEDITLRYHVLKSVIRHLNHVDLNRINHVKMGSDLHMIVRKITGNQDPYIELKKKSNRMALDWLSKFGTMKNHNSFMSAIYFAAIGNMIDYGAMKTTETPESLMAKAVKGGIDSTKVIKVKQLVNKSKQVLYICDNAGEIAFDKLLVSAIKTLGTKVTVAVRGGPIMNDATIEDAFEVKMTRLARIISTGTNVCGIFLPDSSPEFLNAFSKADLIISKGQGNLESLINIDQKPTTVYILKVKCNLIANYLKTKIGSNEIVIQKTIKRRAHIRKS